jgi:hypothetical protein
MFNRIRRAISAPGTLLMDEEFRMVAMEEFIARYSDDSPRNEIRDFLASSGFVAYFKRRNRFRSRRQYKRTFTAGRI